MIWSISNLEAELTSTAFISAPVGMNALARVLAPVGYLVD
jgi:hypothetical protein